MAKSKIEWTDETDNPIRAKGGGWYCTKVSEGCTNCYAEAINHAGRFGGNGLPYRVMHDPPELELNRDMLAKWARMQKPKRHFVASMTDIFGEFVPDEWIFEILDAMAAAPLQTFQVLTKRIERAAILVPAYLAQCGLGCLPDNIWMGTSIENQARADERLPWLIKIPCKTRFVSCEPLLGPLDLRPWLESGGLDWVIVGGESGPHARPMEAEWVRDIRDQCQAAGVLPFFFKQWGGVRKKEAGRTLDGREWMEFPLPPELRSGPGWRTGHLWSITMPKRIQLKRAKGWRIPANTVIIDRRGKWGNPYKLDGAHIIDTTTDPPRHFGFKDEAEAREKSVWAFGIYVEQLLAVNPDYLEPLRGKDLACWCGSGELCHGDVYLKLLYGEDE